MGREPRTPFIIDSIPDGIITFDPSGVIDSFNKTAQRLFGYHTDDIIGQSINLLFSTSTNAPLGTAPNSCFAADLKQFLGTSREITGHRKNGSEFPISFTANEISLATDHFYTGIIRDLTEFKIQEQSNYELNEMFNTVVEGTASYIHVRDLQGRYLYVNSEYEHVFQCKKDAIIGKHYLEVLQPETALAVGLNERQLIHTQTAFQTETAVERPDGPHIYLVSRSPLKNKAGKMIATMGVGIDITRMKELERKSAQTLASLRASEERWKFALEGGGEGVWDWDLLTNKVQYSKRWKEMIGYGEDEISDALEEWSGRVHPDDMALVLEDVNANMDGRTVSFSNEHRFLQKDGSYKWIHDRGMVVQRDESGTPTRMVGTHSDISERKTLERIKGEFISTVSHELRTPLTSIHGALGLLEAGIMGDIPPRVLDVLHIAKRNSERLILLVNDILDMEKLLSGKMLYTTDSVNLGELLNLSIESNAAYAANYGVSYRLINLEEEIVLADTNRLLQVMANMMSNAAKFSPSNSLVTLGYTRHGKFIRVTVEDQGTGIPDEFQDRIFSAFSQANSTDRRTHGGTGLGLNISKKLMLDMGGDMGYRSSPGVGTTFWIDLVRAEQAN